MTAESAPLGEGDLAASRREQLLRESHVANDAFWFYAVHELAGTDVANALNARVVRQFGSLEMARLIRLLRVTELTDADVFVTLLERALELFVKDLFRAELTRTPGKVHLAVQRCFAYEGVRRAGLEHSYRCGPGQRLLGWIAGGDAPVSVTPEVAECQMAKTGRCSYTLDLSALARQAEAAPPKRSTGS